MLQIETIENLAGFGSGNLPGEYYHSENLISGQFGLEANISIVEDSVTNSPARFNWFAEIDSFLNPGVYAVDTSGKIFYKTGGVWGQVRNPGSSHGNGLIMAEGHQILYARDEFLGLFNGGTSWFDSYKDFGKVSTEPRPMELYEDWVLIGNEEDIALYNTLDSSFTADAFTLPSRFIVRAIKSNQTGVLIGANYQGRSIVFLWDVRSTRSISEWIWFDQPIQSICKYGSRWIVTTTKEQIITDGYSTAKLPSPPDVLHQEAVFNVLPAGTLVIDNKLYTANTSDKYNRLKSGLYIQDLTSGLFQFVPVANGCRSGVTMGAMFQDSDLNHYISYATSLPSGNFVAQIDETSPVTATLISPKLGAGPNNKVAEGLQLDISANPKTSTLNSAGSFDVSVKIYNFKRQLWGYGVTNGISADEDELRVDGTLSGKNNAKVGDEITILSGANAGQVRHITAIANAGTNTETWTLNSELPNLTESGAYLNVQPFQLVKTKTVSISDLSELQSIYFDIRNRIKGRKFLAKIVISNISTIALATPSLSFIYDDLGVI